MTKEKEITSQGKKLDPETLIYLKTEVSSIYQNLNSITEELNNLTTKVPTLGEDETMTQNDAEI